MDTPLFRQEAYVTQELGDGGRTTIYQPLSARLIAAGAALFCAVLLLFVCSVEYTNKASVKGFLEPASGLVAVWAPHTGVLREVYVKEGQNVKKGEPLLVVAAERASLHTEDTQEQVLRHLEQRRDNLLQTLANERQLMELEITTLGAAHRKLRAEREQVALEIVTAQKKLDSQQQILARYRSLQNNHFVSELEVEQAQHKMLDYEVAMQALQKRQIQIIAELESAEQDVSLRRLRSEKEIKSFERQINTLEQEIAEQHQQHATLVLAPAHGRITSLPVRRDQMVTGNQRLLTLVPDNTSLQAILLVPTKSAGFLQSGQPVTLRFNAFSYQKFGISKGEVSAVDKSLTLPGDGELPVPLEEAVYRVAVTLQEQKIQAHGQVHSLQPGMTLEADIRLERRKLIEWIFEPIWSFSRKTG